MMRLNANYDVISLIAALTLLLATSVAPTIEVERDIKSYMIFVDVTQSMNVLDMAVAGKPASRLEYTKKLLKEIVKNLPCNSRVGLGVFFRNTVALLYTPIETCSNYNILLDTIDHLEWRMASHGSSNIRLGLQSISSALTTSGNPAQVVFITDGEEAAPLNIFSKVSLAGWQGGRDWLLVGVGGNRPTPIPKLNAYNEMIGYWSTYSIKMESATQVNEGANNVRDESIATEPYEYYLSKLDEPYMKELALDIGAQYLRADKSENLVFAMNNQKFSTQYQSKFKLSWILAFIAMLLMLSAYMPDAIKKLATSRKSRITTD
jgi:mxaL protein